MASPEIQKAIQEAVASSVAAAMAELTKASHGVDQGTKDLFSQMALAIAETADQGTSRKRVAPEILAQRAKAAELCDKLLREAREQGLKPEYRVIAKVNFGDRVIDPWRRLSDKTVVPQEILWTGPPNEALRPINAVAERIFDAYRDSIGSTEKLKSVRHANGGIVAPDNRPYWVTPGGLVVKGDAPARFAVGNQESIGGNVGDFKDNNDPTAPEVRVLGTIAAPARRNTDTPLETRAS